MDGISKFRLPAIGDIETISIGKGGNFPYDIRRVFHCRKVKIISYSKYNHSIFIYPNYLFLKRGAFVKQRHPLPYPNTITQKLFDKEAILQQVFIIG